MALTWLGNCIQLNPSNFGLERQLLDSIKLSWNTAYCSLLHKWMASWLLATGKILYNYIKYT